jgi:hypothetical protein
MTRTRGWLAHEKKPGGGARLPPCSGTEMRQSTTPQDGGVSPYPKPNTGL